MLQHDRYTKIKEYLIGNKAASTAALAEHLGVSTVTIRKDLDSLEQSGIVKRTHGGAMLAEGQQAAPQICACKAIPDRMKKIAELAKNYVLPGDFVFLGSALPWQSALRTSAGYPSSRITFRSCRSLSPTSAISFFSAGRS